VKSLDIRPDMDQAPWIDINPFTVLHGSLERVGLLRNGTREGLASVSLAIRLADGRMVVAETTWRLFNIAARALASSPAAAEETP
jgi:hypothetical protein